MYMMVESMSIPGVKSTFFKIRGWTTNPWEAYLLQILMNAQKALKCVIVMLTALTHLTVMTAHVQQIRILCRFNVVV